MAFEEVMFRNSVWSHDNRDIMLHGFGELNTPWNNADNGGTLSAPEPVSKFSADSDDYYDDYDDGYVEYSSSHPTSSPLSHLSRRTERHEPGLKPGSPLQMSRTYTIAQRPRMYSAPQIRRSSEYEGRSSKQVQSDAVVRDETALQEKTDMPLLSETLFVATICIAQLCAQAGIGQTLPITTGVGSRFRVANANNLSSSIAAYTVTLGTFVLISCRLGETFGNKRVFIVGLAWSSVWSLIVGASFYSTRSLFITSRAFQGLGAALTLPTGLAMLRATRRIGVRKAVIFTFYAAMSPIGLIGGALGASILVELAWWPWVFWAYSITLVVLGAISCFTLPSDPRARSALSGVRDVTLDLDLPGMITGSTSLGLFGFAWTQAHAVGWQQAYVGIILLISLIFAGLFVMIEICYAPKPLIPYSAMSWGVFWIVVAIGCGWSCFGIWIFYGWQFVERFRPTSPLLTTAYFAPNVAVGCCAAATTRFILRRVGLHAMFCVALLSITVGGVIMSTMRVWQTYWEQLFISVLFMAWGLHTSVPVATLMILKAVNKKHGGIAASLVCTATYYGVGLGLGVAGTVERNVMSGRLTAYHRLRGFTAVYWTSVGLAAFGFAVCLALAWVPRLRLTLENSSRREQRPCCDYECQGAIGGQP